MILDSQMRYGLDDVSMIPEPISTIQSRSECIPFYPDYKLPLFTAPMSAVVDTDNFKVWEKYNITPILPRNIDFDIRREYSRRGCWVAWSLKEFKDEFIVNKGDLVYNKDITNAFGTTYALIDVANGHMNMLLELIRESKQIAFDKGINLIIMVGNIARPETYDYLSDAGADFIRVGIGGGNVCITSTQTSINYPMASLLNEINIRKQNRKSNKLHCANVVADGGIRNYADIIKCLGLGADYVMCGSLFASFIESAAKFNCDDGTWLTVYRSDVFDDVPETIKDRHNNNENKNHYLKGFIHFTKNIKNTELWVIDNSAEFDEMVDKIVSIEKETKECYHFIQTTETYPISTRESKHDRDDVNISSHLYICADGNLRFNEWFADYLLQNYKNLTKDIIGMSTREAQKLIGDTKTLKTSEGTKKTLKCTTNIKQWTSNFKDYLKSAMSYTNTRTLGEFVGNVDLIIRSTNAMNVINK